MRETNRGGALIRALRLPRRESALAVRAFGWLAVADAATALLPHRCSQRLLKRIAIRTRPRRPPTVDELARAIVRAASVMPWTTCLSRALGGACLLRRNGLDATLSIGVRTSRSAGFAAHAWIESEDVAVIGEPARDYVVLLRTAF